MNRLKPFAFLFILLLTAVAGRAQTTLKDQGIYYTEIEQYGNARKTFHDLVKQTPTGESHYLLGDFYLRLYKVDSLPAYIDSAKMYFSQGLAKEPAYALNHVGMGAISMFNKNKEEAKKHFGTALSMTKSKDVEVLHRVGESYIMFDYNDPVAAIETLNKAVGLKDGKKPEVYLTLGDAFLMQNDGGMANTNYDYALKANPKLAKAYIRSGKVLIRAKNYTDALALYKKGIDADPSYSPGYREMGELYFLAGQYDKAITNYKQYIDKSDHNPDTRFKYAAFLFLNKDYKAAIDELAQLDKTLANPVIHRLLGYSYYETQQFAPGADNMEVFFKEIPAAKILPTDYEYYGRLLLKSGKDTVKAIENLEKAATLDATKAVTIYSEIADVHYKAKKYGKAAEVYTKAAASAEKPNVNTYLNMGKAYYYDKNNAMADTTFSKVIELAPQSPTGYLWKARAKVRLDKDFSQGLAVPFYEKYIELVAASPETLEKAKKDYTESAIVIGYYYLNTKRDKAKADSYFDKVLAVDPANAKATEGKNTPVPK